MPSPKLAFEITETADEVRLAVSGELDMATGPSLEQAAFTRLRQQPRLLILDLQRVAFCDSSGIACLLHIQKAAATAGSRIQLHNVRDLVRRVLDLAGVNQILGVQPAEPSPGSE